MQNHPVPYGTGVVFDFHSKPRIFTEGFNARVKTLFHAME